MCDHGSSTALEPDWEEPDRLSCIAGSLPPQEYLHTHCCCGHQDSHLGGSGRFGRISCQLDAVQVKCRRPPRKPPLPLWANRTEVGRDTCDARTDWSHTCSTILVVSRSYSTVRVTLYSLGLIVILSAHGQAWVLPDPRRFPRTVSAAPLGEYREHVGAQTGGPQRVTGTAHRDRWIR